MNALKMLGLLSRTAYAWGIVFGIIGVINKNWSLLVISGGCIGIGAGAGWDDE